VLVDTAGIRRRGRIEEGIEKYALLRTAHALERADVAILMTDAIEGVTAQDVHIAGYALEAQVGLVLAENKWDVVDRGAEMTANVEAEVAREFHFVPWMKHHFVSAKTGRNVKPVLADALAIVDERKRKIPTADLHRMLMAVVAAHPPTPYRGKEVRFTHVTQARGKAPTFVFFVDPPSGVHFTYQRYLENALRERFGFDGTPIKLEFKAAHE
jgi:GTP-binding protein